MQPERNAGLGCGNSWIDEEGVNVVVYGEDCVSVREGAVWVSSEAAKAVLPVIMQQQLARRRNEERIVKGELVQGRQVATRALRAGATESFL